MRINRNQGNFNFPSETLFDNNILTFGEFFAGGGGWTHGIDKVPGVKTKWILNHDKVAIATNAFHHQDAKVYWADIYAQDEHELEYVDCVHASIECTQHSNANGGKSKKIGSYTMADELYRYIKFLMPLVLTIENVPEFKKWGPVDKRNNPIKEKQGESFKKWVNAICALGYEYQESIRNAADDGMPTRRVRYFAMFSRPGLNVSFPSFTHAKKPRNGFRKWVACKGLLDLDNEGESIFGREFNTKLRPQDRKPHTSNTLRRIAGGIKKYSPEFHQFICNYYGDKTGSTVRGSSVDAPLNTITTSNRHQLVSVQGKDVEQMLHHYYGGPDDHCQSIDDPLQTITTVNRQQLVTLEKLKFIQDHCHSDNYNTPDEPINPILTRQTKQIVNIICQYYGTAQSQSVDDPLNTVTTKDRHQLVQSHFIARAQNSNGKPEYNVESIDEPVSSVVTISKHQLVLLEKLQFITKYFNSDGNPEFQNNSIEEPLGTLTTVNKQYLVAVLENFDIKTRFLTKEELAACSTFPRNYFSHKELKLSAKNAVRMIGNAVPPMWATIIVGHNVNAIKTFKQHDKIST